MEVNLNFIRQYTIVEYNRLCEKLNNAIENGMITIDPKEIQREMDNLKNGLGVMAFSYIKGNKDFEALDEDTHFEQFNPTKE